MTRDTKKLNPNVIYVKRESLSFLDGEKEVILPRKGQYLPRNDGSIVTYEEERDGLDTRFYSFEDKEGNLEALYGVKKDGSVTVKHPGKEEVLVSKNDMDKISKRTVKSLSEKSKVLNCGGKNNGNTHKNKKLPLHLIQAKFQPQLQHVLCAIYL